MHVFSLESSLSEGQILLIIKFTNARINIYTIESKYVNNLFFSQLRKSSELVICS